ncbi:MAG: alpha/beta hydrolase fold domain-containing protein [Pseudomonadales bacterium]|nr:alpha/beta hydrolase fold domain-containing protein [Pseudomonadales bacterium]
MPDTDSDPRLDPRIRGMLAAFPMQPQEDATDRASLVAEANTPEALAAQEQMKAGFAMLDTEDVAPTAGLDISTHEFTSTPDGNTINIQFIRPESDDALPCVYYIHGGGMQSMSCFDGMYKSWGRIIAHQGVAVAMVDFRNCLTASSAPEIEPYPAGLNDCVSGLKWLVGEAATLNIDPAHIIVAGESGGGNLTLATGLKLLKEGDMGLVRGLYALCPYIAGEWPQDNLPSSTENNGILLDLHNNRGKVAYGIEAFDAEDPLAWPLFATDADLKGLVPTVISVNECDPLRDEGIEFYRALLRAEVPARCRQVMGTSHGIEIFAIACPDISRETAASIAQFCREA